MVIQAYGAGLAIVALSIVFGQAICCMCASVRRAWAGPAVGLSALVVLTTVSIKLPGRAVTAIVICAIGLAASIALLVRRRLWPVVPGDLAVAGVALAGASLPFLASARIGLQGVGLDNDTALHLLWAEGLRSPRMAKLWPPQGGYPLGPHSVIATLGTAFNIPLDMALTGLLIAVVPITALVAARLLDRQALWRRIVMGIMCSLVYLASAFYGEGAFKETIMACLLLSFVVCLLQMRQVWTETSWAARWVLTLPAGLLIAAAVYTYSVYGLLWFVATLGAWTLAYLARNPRAAGDWVSGQRLRAAAPSIALIAGLGILALLPIASQLASFINTVGLSPAGSGTITKTNLGNLLSPLPPGEALGIWWTPDFRHTPPASYYPGVLTAFALAVVVFGILRSIRSGELLLPSAAASAGLIWWYSARTQSPYVAAKALAIASPLFVAVGLRALLTPPIRREKRASVLPVTAAVVYVVFSAYSSFDTLRTEPVQAPEAGRELASFHRTIGNAPVLFLGADDFSPWQLRESAVATLSVPTLSAGGAISRPNKPFGEQNLDFDSVDPNDLDNFPYVITTNTDYASQPPPSFRLIARGPLYELWKRTGPTPFRSTVELPGQPGGILDCGSRLGKSLQASRGVAALMQPPVIVAGPGLSAGQTATVQLPLPRGEWQLSVQSMSAESLEFASQGKRWRLPAYLGRPGPSFAIGVVHGMGVASPVALTVRASRPSFLDSHWPVVSVGLIDASRLPNTRRIVPLRQACGKYIDWFATDSSGQR